jgi:hypothetical protein
MKCMNVKACMHVYVLMNVYVLCFMKFHARCIGMHKSLNGKELMYMSTAGLHMMIS